MYESYIEEEERLQNELKDMCQSFQEKFIETNERLARKFYQLFKEQGIINYDDVGQLDFFENDIVFFLWMFIEISRTNTRLFYQFKYYDRTVVTSRNGQSVYRLFSTMFYECGDLSTKTSIRYSE